METTGAGERSGLIDHRAAQDCSAVLRARPPRRSAVATGTCGQGPFQMIIKDALCTQPNMPLVLDFKFPMITNESTSSMSRVINKMIKTSCTGNILAMFTVYYLVRGQNVLDTLEHMISLRGRQQRMQRVLSLARGNQGDQTSRGSKLLDHINQHCNGTA